MNKSKRTGTEGENWWRDNFLKLLWPNAERDERRTPGSDFLGVPVAFEAKRRKVWEIPKWTRYLTELHDDDWVLLVSPRDRRRKDAPPDLVIMPYTLALEVFDGWADDKGVER